MTSRLEAEIAVEAEAAHTEAAGKAVRPAPGAAQLSESEVSELRAVGLEPPRAQWDRQGQLAVCRRGCLVPAAHAHLARPPRNCARPLTVLATQDCTVQHTCFVCPYMR